MQHMHLLCLLNCPPRVPSLFGVFCIVFVVFIWGILIVYFGLWLRRRGEFGEVRKAMYANPEAGVHMACGVRQLR